MPKAALTAAQKAKLCAEYIAGATVEALAKQYGVGTSTVARYLKAAKVSAADRRTAKAAEQPKPREEFIQQYESLGPVPDDPIEAMSHGRKLLMMMAQQVLTDREYKGSERERRREAKDLIKSAAAMKDEDAIADALRQLKEDQDELENPGPEVKDLAARQHRRPRKQATS